MFGAILGAVAPGLVGGLFNRREQRAANQTNERLYRESVRDNRADIADERRWQEAARDNERRYQEGQARFQRHFEGDLRLEERRRADRLHGEDQARLDRMADRSVETRGVDFQRLRDQAVAAGFNPMSVLGTAGMYSTEWQGSLAPRQGTSGISGAGGMMAGGSGMSTAGMGGGYMREFTPALTTGSFLAEAVQRGIDTTFNTPVANDPLADALRKALNTDRVVSDAQAANPRRPFGYDLQEVAPYTPARTVSRPAIQKAATSPSDESVDPSSLPIKWNGGDFDPSGKFSDAEAAEARYGEIGGEILGLDSLIYDVGKNARRRFDGWRSRRNAPQAPRSRPPLNPRRGGIPDGYGGVYW